MEPIIERWRKKSSHSDWEEYQGMDDDGLYKRLLSAIKGNDSARAKLIRGILANRIGRAREMRKQ
jgi:hypothetical protein